MGIKHQVTFTCDACGTEFIIDEHSMDMPPNWLGLQIVASDSDGCIPDIDYETFAHFCSQDCLVEYTSSSEMRSKLATVGFGDEKDVEEEEREL